MDPRFWPYFRQGRDGKLRGVGWNFNYWGEKRAPSGDEHIAKVATRLITNSPTLAASTVTEGGAIEVDGKGTFMAAETAIINENRNPGMTKERIEEDLSRLLGIQKFIWLAGEADRETTDCHIDALARFIRPGVVIISKPSPQGAGKYSFAYDDARERLSKATDAQGEKITLYDCVEPDLGKLQRVSEGENCVASYVNFLNVNGGVIIPKFGDEARDAFLLETNFFKSIPQRRCSGHHLVGLLDGQIRIIHSLNLDYSYPCSILRNPALIPNRCGYAGNSGYTGDSWLESCLQHQRMRRGIREVQCAGGTLCYTSTRKRPQCIRSKLHIVDKSDEASSRYLHRHNEF
jgi:agmatine/peptidylarginine deiminase